MLLDSVFQNFLEQKPLSVMARAALERMLSVSRLEALFRQVASVQYERDLLFSGLVEVIARVVTRVGRSRRLNRFRVGEVVERSPDGFRHMAR